MPVVVVHWQAFVRGETQLRTLTVVAVGWIWCAQALLQLAGGSLTSLAHKLQRGRTSSDGRESPGVRTGASGGTAHGTRNEETAMTQPAGSSKDVPIEII